MLDARPPIWVLCLGFRSTIRLARSISPSENQNQTKRDASKAPTEKLWASERSKFRTPVQQRGLSTILGLCPSEAPSSTAGGTTTNSVHPGAEKFPPRRGRKA